MSDRAVKVSISYLEHADSLDTSTFDWNLFPARPTRETNARIEFRDETLRDGLQSPSVATPSDDDKISILRYMAAIGIDDANIGLPGASEQAKHSVERLASAVDKLRLPLTLSCAARTHPADIRAVIDVVQRTGVPITIDIFLGSSPIRQYVEGWDIAWLRTQTLSSVAFAVKEQLKVMFVTEDSTRTDPLILRELYAAAIDCGATRICLCDTVGHATPAGAHNVVQFVRRFLTQKDPAVKLDWHGHSDRGLAVANTLSALAAGVDRVHGCLLGIGERAGNTSLDSILLILKDMKWIDNDLAELQAYARFAAQILTIPHPLSFPR